MNFCVSVALRQDIHRRMISFEANYKRDHEPSIVQMYCHWFLSIFAMAECVTRFCIHGAIILVVLILYYILLCISCGKGKVSLNAYLSDQYKLFGLYSGLLCGIICNFGKYP